ncbi:MAG TPA: SPOR domain-containing protein [Steroidobacteraceae bacterium]|nr:SPOR domain-containing protein [Steroidobacteraceae bacterium]
MERQVKERLVGAAVLMAAAIILIPEMLSGPDRESQTEQPAHARNDAPIKTYTIDLNQAPGAQATPAVVDDRTPPPEEPTAAQPAAQPDASAQVKPEAPQQPAEQTPAPEEPQPAPQPPPARVEQPQPARTEPARPVVEPPTATVAATPTPPQRALASSPAAPTSGRWAVQVGSFSKEATAERLAKQLRDQGHDAFVMPVKSSGATLYRVRIGPLPDRASAEAALRNVKTLAPGAAVVAHP